MPTAPTLTTMVRELGLRLGELALSTPTSAGTSTTLIDTSLTQFWPQDIDTGTFNVYVYGSPTADTANVGVERRATSWQASSGTATLYAPGFATGPTTGLYEIHTRTSHARKVEAINTGVRALGLSWYRHVMNESSIVTAANTWRYELPDATLWTGGGWRVELQVNTNADFVGYPYIDASPWNPQLHQETTAAGVTTWYLQFGILPPTDRIVRIYGEAAFTDLAAEADILPLDEPTAGMAYEWLLMNAAAKLWEWEGNRMPAGQVERIQAWLQTERASTFKYLVEHAPAHRNGRVVTPGRGDGQLGGGWRTDDQWLAAFNQNFGN